MLNELLDEVLRVLMLGTELVAADDAGDTRVWSVAGRVPMLSALAAQRRTGGEKGRFSFAVVALFHAAGLTAVTEHPAAWFGAASIWKLPEVKELRLQSAVASGHSDRLVSTGNWRFVSGE